jgi:hypothetical protein
VVAASERFDERTLEPGRRANSSTCERWRRAGERTPRRANAGDGRASELLDVRMLEPGGRANASTSERWRRAGERTLQRANAGDGQARERCDVRTLETGGRANASTSERWRRAGEQTLRRANAGDGRASELFDVFGFVLSYSHVAYLDYGGVPFIPFPRRCPHDGGTLQAFLCPPPRTIP